MLLKRKTVLYFAPHQDDELLSMGVDIATNVAKKQNVHVILCSDGSKSSVRKRLGDGKSCDKHPGDHIYEITEEEFTAARDKEFWDSCAALGVPQNCVHIAQNRGVDGSVTTQTVASIMRHFLKRFGSDAIVCTISKNNGDKQHCDHKTLGHTAQYLFNKGEIKELRLFIEPYHLDAVEENPRLVPVEPTVIKADGKIAEKIEKAIGAYSLWEPENDRFAVGCHSVSKEFAAYLKDKSNYCFTLKKDEDMSFKEKLYRQHKKWENLQRQKQLFWHMEKCEKPDLGDLTLITVHAGETEKFRQFCQQYSYTLREKDIDRLRQGSSFWCLVLEGAVVSTCWLAYKQPFYIGETDFGFDMDKSESAIFFDANTMPDHRGKGYYGLLLRSMVSGAVGPQNFIAYTSPSNKSSANGINKAGFIYDGTLGADQIMTYLQKQNYTKIYRRYRLKGYIVK